MCARPSINNHNKQTALNFRLKMATWASGKDILSDLDKLSDFGNSSTENFDLLASIGRGVPINRHQDKGKELRKSNKESRTPSPLHKETEHIPLAPLPRFRPGAGRGERIMSIGSYKKEDPLERQLRNAMGKGYSNELIEEYIRGETGSNSSSEPGQFDSAESSTSKPSSAKGEASPVPILKAGVKLPDYFPQSMRSQSPEVPDQKSPEPEPETEPESTKTTAENIKPKEKVPRRCRNALLNSLPTFNKNLSEKTEPGINSDIALSVKEPFEEAGDFKRFLAKSNTEFKLKSEDFPPL